MNISCCANQQGGWVKTEGRKDTHTLTRAPSTFPAKFTLKGAAARSHNFLLTKVFAVKCHRSNLQEVRTPSPSVPRFQPPESRPYTRTAAVKIVEDVQTNFNFI